MQVMVRNAEGNLTQLDKDYAASKFSRLDRFFNQAHKVEIVHREERHDHKPCHRIEVTVVADGYTVRGEDFDSSIRAAIDRVTDKLENRLKRLKGRLVASHRRKGTSLPEALLELEEANSHEEEHHHEIKERKQISLKPTSYEEAGLQLEAVGHPFYIFKSEVTGYIEVIYKRKDGHYGLLQPIK